MSTSEFGMRPRIVGSEMEYSLVTDPAVIQWVDGKAKGTLLHHLPADIIVERLESERSLGGFTSIGSRIYKDLGEHYEYATGEEDTFWGVVAAEIVGEQIMLETVRNAIKAPYTEIKEIWLNKRVLDSKGNAWGYHENYLSHRGDITLTQDGVDRTAVNLLLLHLATRNLWAGAGAIVNGKFLLAQKPSSLRTDIGEGTTKVRPLLNVRDESHLGREEGEYSRVHITSGDANMSPWAIFMKFATTSLVLRLVEHGETLPEIQLGRDRNYKLAQQVATDLTMRKTVRLENGTTIRPLEIQETIIDRARKFAEQHELPEEEQQALREWERAHDDMSIDPDYLCDRSDWVAKRMTIEKYTGTHIAKGDYDPKLLVGLDQGFDDLEESGVAQNLRKSQKGWAKWMPTELIEARHKAPCPNTRAHLRGQLVRHAYSGPLRSNIRTHFAWGQYSIEHRPLASGPSMTPRVDLGILETDHKDSLTLIEVLQDKTARTLAAAYKNHEKRSGRATRSAKPRSDRAWLPGGRAKSQPKKRLP